MVDQQVSQISEYGQRKIEAEKELKELRPQIKLVKLANERLSNSVGALEREKREREKRGDDIDGRAEQGCEAFVRSLFLSLSCPLLAISQSVAEVFRIESDMLQRSMARVRTTPRCSRG